MLFIYALVLTNPFFFEGVLCLVAISGALLEALSPLAFRALRFQGLGLGYAIEMPFGLVTKLVANRE